MASVLAACSSSIEKQKPTYGWEKIDALKEEYGRFSIYSDYAATKPSLLEDGNYHINVAAYKAVITVSGYFEGQIIIENGNNLENFKGVELKLEKACLISYNGPTIEYKLDSKKIEISPRASTTNCILAADEDGSSSIFSKSNIEISGKGSLEIYSKSGHCVNAEDGIKVFNSPNLFLYSGHDGFHGDYFVTSNGEITDYKPFLGTINVLYAFSQAFDCTKFNSSGYISLLSGNFKISNCESVFKTDVSLIIDCNVTSTGILLDPVIKGDNSQFLDLTVEIWQNGSFTIDGNNYESRVL